MNKIIKALKDVWSFLAGIRTASTHQKRMVWIPLLIGLAAAPTGYCVTAMWVMLILGLVMEFMYCHGALKTVTWGAYSFKVWDFKQTMAEIKGFQMKTRHKFDEKNFYYVLVAIVATVLAAIAFRIFN